MNDRQKTVVFTLCSNNYLPQARVLAETLKRHNPAYRFMICLVDERDESVDYSRFPGEFIFLAQTGILKKIKCADKYDIIELNTSIKPFLFQYILISLLDK